ALGELDLTFHGTGVSVVTVVVATVVAAVVGGVLGVVGRGAGVVVVVTAGGSDQRQRQQDGEDPPQSGCSHVGSPWLVCCAEVEAAPRSAPLSVPWGSRT